MDVVWGSTQEGTAAFNHAVPTTAQQLWAGGWLEAATGISNGEHLLLLIKIYICSVQAAVSSIKASVSTLCQKP